MVVCAWLRLCFALRGGERCTSHLIPARLHPPTVALSEVQALRLSSQAASLHSRKHTHTRSHSTYKSQRWLRKVKVVFRRIFLFFLRNATIEIYTATASSAPTVFLWQRETPHYFYLIFGPLLCKQSHGIENIVGKKKKRTCDSLASKLHFSAA